MKGVILAGGSGTRLSPITKVINKHLLPVGRFPMIYWPIIKCKEAGITDVIVITNEKDINDFIKLLGHGEGLGVTLKYEIQDRPLGIAHGLQCAKEFVGDDKFVLLLGDNLFEDALSPIVSEFCKQEKGARVILKQVTDPSRYGVATIRNDHIASIIEKPEKPLSSYAVIGVYMYDKYVFEKINSIQFSSRGELEITDVNNIFIQEQDLKFSVLNGWWIDAGTHESLFKANQLINQM